MSKTALASPKNGLQGLSIQRRFSKPGTHPFDEVEWEIRDAVIGNPESPAFEQRGVEFPVTWSQNATNIVAQKYFRGQMGSPERESSVKQMIGRVAWEEGITDRLVLTVAQGIFGGVSTPAGSPGTYHHG